MSKKLAAGADGILLDVKTGSGAFMKTVEGATELAKTMVAIGEAAHKPTMALVTDMDIPLGYAIGNTLEVIEAIDTLSGNGPKDLTELSLQLSAYMLMISQAGDFSKCYELAKAALDNGEALKVFRRMIAAQGGDDRVLDDRSLFAKAAYILPVTASKSGWVSQMDTEAIGVVSMILGAGRRTKDSGIDSAAGLLLKVKPGDYLNEGETAAVLYTNDSQTLPEASQKIIEAIFLTAQKPLEKPLILAKVFIDNVEYCC